MQTVIASQREQIDKQGFTIISKHDNVTGEVVAFFPEYEDDELRTKWVKIGKSNPWIRQAVDPPFSKNSLHKCQTRKELKEKLKSGNWCLGQGFYWENICFINQVNAGDEWMVIKDDLDFESINAIPKIKKGTFDSFLDRVVRANKEELRLLEY